MIDFDLRGKAAIVTGGSRGIGRAIALALAEQGVDVAICGRTEKTLIQTAEEISAHGVRAWPIVADVSRLEEIQAFVAEATGEAGRVDILINNAGISGGYKHQVFGGIRYDHFSDVFATNFMAPLKMAEAFIEHVAASTQKKIMNISSMPSSIGLSTGGQYIDRPSKTSLNMVMHSLSKEVAKRGVIVGLLAPGLVDTDLTRELDFPKISPENSVAMLIELIEKFSPEQSGTLIQHTGETLPW